jgi:acyl-CoA synthetase (AMP-forming)/AMP-acid ligase II
MTNLAATGGVPGPGRIGRVAIGDLLKRAAQRFPERIAVTDGERRVTFTEIERDANRFANYLVTRGMKPGEKISTICNNSVEFVKALFGIHRAGLAAVVGLPHPQWGVTANGKLRKVELRQAFAEHFVKVVDITSRHSGARAKRASPESITTTGSMDSGAAPSGASRNDE